MNSQYGGFAGRMFHELLAAESRLTGARENFRAAVKATGRPTDGIFSTTLFVKRSLMAARLAEMEAENSKALKAALGKKSESGDDDQDDRDDRDGDNNEGDDDGWEIGEDGKRRRKKKAMEPKPGKPIDDEQHPPGENDTTPDRHQPSGTAYERAVKATAAAIIAAGARARGLKPRAPSQARSAYESNLQIAEAEYRAGRPVHVTATMIIAATRRPSKEPLSRRNARSTKRSAT